MLKAMIKARVKESHWLFLSWHKSNFGIWATLLSYGGFLLNGRIARVHNPVISTSIFIRPGTTDQDVFDEIFIDREYDLDFGDPLFIIDAGAHTGLSSVFFAIKYPQASIVALEPESSNYALLTKNAKAYKNIHPINAGLWSHKGFLQIQNPDAATWSFQVTEAAGDEGIAALSVPDIMSTFNVNEIDVLKMDIEGSEIEVMNHSKSWIEKVQTLIIELHDRFRPGCSESLEHAVAGLPFSRSVSGESVVLSAASKRMPARFAVS